jgi:allantoinase
MSRLVIRGQRVVLPEGEQAASLHIDRGVIVRVAGFDAGTEGAPVVEAGELVVLPGLVDTHVHVNDPGRAEWEGFDTATRAAAAGGITTIVDMPLNSVPPTVTVAALEAKRSAAHGRVHVDVAFWGGIVPGHEQHIEPLALAGVRGFKCFLAPSGVDEFPCVSEADLRRALPALARASAGRLPLLVHAEDPTALVAAAGPPRAYATFLAARPAAAEARAIELIAALSAEYHVHAHIVHVSSGEGLDVVARARAAGVTMTAETCPHYLTFTADDVGDGETAFKCAPPIRAAAHRARLWDGLRAGTCDLIASDHSPAPPSLKAVESGDFLAAWGGVASLELSLAAVWTGACARGLPALDVAQWMSRRPALLCGLGDRKGALQVGYDADVVLWNPDARCDVDSRLLQQRHKLTPYSGRTLRGAVNATFLRGERIWDGHGLTAPGRGRLL